MRPPRSCRPRRSSSSGSPPRRPDCHRRLRGRALLTRRHRPGRQRDLQPERTADLQRDRRRTRRVHVPERRKLPYRHGSEHGGDDALSITFGVGSRGGVTLSYGTDTPLDVDLTSEGGNAIVVSMTAATPTVSFLSSSLGVGVMDMDFNSAGAALEFTGGGDYVFPFTVLEQFGIDLENIREILVQVSSEEPATVRSYAISAVTVGFVPERTLGVLAVSAVA